MGRTTSAHVRNGLIGNTSCRQEAALLIGVVPTNRRMLSRQAVVPACRENASTEQAIESDCGKRPIASCLPSETAISPSIVPAPSCASVIGSTSRL